MDFRLSPATLAHRITEGQYRLFPHVKLLNQRLMDVVAGRVRRLAVSMPPRHGKSELISHFLPAWYLMMHRTKRVILTSYGADFAADWGRKARSVIEEFGPSLYGVEIDPRSSAADRWDLKGHAGGMITAGAGGPITGRGGSLIIVDDPIKNMEEAQSQLQRDKIWDWFRSALLTRGTYDVSVIVVMTRWNEDDLIGRLLRSDGPKWEIMRLPAIAECDEPWGRKRGEALCPGLFPLKTLESIRSEVGSYVWAGLYQQRPAPPEGGIIKSAWFKGRRWVKGVHPGEIMLGSRLVDLQNCTRFLTVDMAVSQKQTADWTVIGMWALSHDGLGSLILLDVLRDRMEGPDILPNVKKMVKKGVCAFAGIETTSFQLSVVQAARRMNIPVRELHADKDKVTRAYAATPLMESGRVWLPEEAVWLADYESELFSFPMGRHDDQVDVTTYACAFAQGMPLAVDVGDPKEKPETVEPPSFKDVYHRPKHNPLREW